MNMLWKVVEEWPKVGLAKEITEDAQGRRCAIGMLDYVMEGDQRNRYANGDWSVALDALSVVAMEQYPERSQPWEGCCPAVELNNHPDTTLLEMVTVAEKAAIKLDELV